MTPVGSGAPGIGEVRRAALRSMPYLVLRQGTAQALHAIGALVLARWLAPADLGVFALVIAVHGAMAVCAGAGWLTSVIRTPEEPGRATLQTGFTMAQALGAFVACACWLVSPHAAASFGLGPSAVTAFRCAGVAAFIATASVVPVTLLERRMRFGALAIVELSQVVAFHAVNLALVWAGWRADAAGVGLIARSMVGAVVASMCCRWPLGYAWSLSEARRIVAFGGPFQSAVLVNMVRDAVVPVAVGAVAGPHVLGLVAWAQNLAALPSMVVGAVTRVLLPAFARLQHDRVALGRLLSESVTASHAVAAPLTVSSVVLITPLIDVVFGPSWRPAIPVFLLCSVANLFAPTVAPVLALHHAIGRPLVALLASVAWTAVLLGVAVPLAFKWGAFGYGVGHVASQAVNLALFASARREAPFSVARAMTAPWAAATCAALCLGLTLRLVELRGVVALAATGMLGIVVYAMVMWGLSRGLRVGTSHFGRWA